MGTYRELCIVSAGKKTLTILFVYVLVSHYLKCITQEFGIHIKIRSPMYIRKPFLKQKIEEITIIPFIVFPFILTYQRASRTSPVFIQELCVGFLSALNTETLGMSKV